MRKIAESRGLRLACVLDTMPVIACGTLLRDVLGNRTVSIASNSSAISSNSFLASSVIRSFTFFAVLSVLSVADALQRLHV
jgi:hypothetical protein